MKVKKIVTVNEMLSDNIGDQAISKAMKDYCYIGEGCRVDCKDFSFREKYSNGVRSLKAKTVASKVSKFLPSIIKKIILLFKNSLKANSIAKEKYDLAIIGGGQLILSNASFSVNMFLYVMFFKIYGTKVKLASVGVGEEFSLFDKFLYSVALSLVDDIYLRDKKSIKNLKSIFKKNSFYLPDIAYYLSQENIFADIDSNKMLVCPVEYQVHCRYYKELNQKLLSFEEYVDDWAGNIKKILSKNDISEIYFSGTTQKDLEFSQICMEKISKTVKCKLIFSEAESFESFQKIASSCDFIFSGRMHALILGQNLGLKAIPYYSSKKIVGFEEEYLFEKSKYFKDYLKRNRESILN